MAIELRRHPDIESHPFITFEEGVTVRDFIPSEAHIENESVLARVGDVEVLYEIDGSELPFPQKGFRFRNVCTFVLLVDGRIVGFNESPRSGWSFPVLGRKTVSSVIAYEKSWRASGLSDWYLKQVEEHS